MKNTIIIKQLSVFGLLAAMSSPAFAYVGPGAGIGLLGSIAGLAMALGTALAVVVLLPVRAMRKRYRNSLRQSRDETPDASKN